MWALLVSKAFRSRTVIEVDYVIISLAPRAGSHFIGSQLALARPSKLLEFVHVSAFDSTSPACYVRPARYLVNHVIYFIHSHLNFKRKLLIRANS